MNLKACYLVYVCPLCGELSIYAGFCDNFEKHSGENPRYVAVRMRPEVSVSSPVAG